MSYFTDMHFLKLFRLSQLTIEYLLHVQNYLATTLNERDSRLAVENARVAELQATADASNERVANLKRDVKYYRKLAHAYEQLHGPLAAAHLQTMAGSATPGGLLGGEPHTTNTPGPQGDSNSLASSMFSPAVDREGRSVFVRARLFFF